MILLDTHVLLWLIRDPQLIGESSTERLSRSERVYFSAISIAEISIKQMLGKLSAPDDLHAQLPAAGLTALPLTPEHSAGIAEFPELTHHDPFDRLLLAQASAERCHLMTADMRLLDHDWDFVVDARV